MVYQVPASRASIKQNVFEFRVPGSRKVYSIPKMQFLAPKWAEKIATLADEIEGEPTPQQQMDLFRVQMAMLNDYVPGFIDLFDGQDQIGDLIGAWQAASGISLGESSASSES